jgi:hypothetical protein
MKKQSAEKNLLLLAVMIFALELPLHSGEYVCRLPVKRRLSLRRRWRGVDRVKE